MCIRDRICAARGYDSDDAESDRARINFLSTEPVQIVTASGWVFAYDTRDQVQIGAGRNVREVIDAASANLLARAMAEADKKVI